MAVSEYGVLVDQRYFESKQNHTHSNVVNKFQLIGLSILVVGIVFKVNFDPIKDALVNESGSSDFNLDQAGSTLGIGLIILGVIIILVALLGCSGACCKSKVLLVIYALIVIIILIAEIAVVAVALIKGGDAKDVLQKGLLKSLEKYKPNSEDSLSKSFNAIWSTFECCGVYNYTDFKSGRVEGFKFPPKNIPEQIPIGCCKNFDYENAEKANYTDHIVCLTTPTEKNAYIDGCYTALQDSISHYTAVAIGVAVVIVLIEIIVILAAFCLCCRSDDYQA
ncbi:hypothetical protein LOTGIDRAFT_228639 [Lottia gigantea]|uniref:Tetraspanin n=1 Tax=Lottia gigantea TaxID=225164 RepID=V4AAX2_LOTGI|nr:hypothetical protein LOTGIDRAFT_228639 [Lottia gigantea]ESO93927.1 hypothetical protein LOTGIDRAFT_228639 [Lottia gigantea]